MDGEQGSYMNSGRTPTIQWAAVIAESIYSALERSLASCIDRLGARAISLSISQRKRQRNFRGSASLPSMALAVTVAGLARKIRASRDPMRPW